MGGALRVTATALNLVYILTVNIQSFPYLWTQYEMSHSPCLSNWGDTALFLLICNCSKQELYHWRAMETTENILILNSFESIPHTKRILIIYRYLRGVLISKLMAMGSNFWALWPWSDLPFRRWYVLLSSVLELFQPWVLFNTGFHKKFHLLLFIFSWTKLLRNANLQILLLYNYTCQRSRSQTIKFPIGVGCNNSSWIRRLSMATTNGTRWSKLCFCCRTANSCKSKSSSP